MEKKDILCPECNLEYISQKRYNNYGNCIKCQRRQTMAKINNTEYVKYIDLSEDEKTKLEKQRETRRKSAKRSRDIKSGKIKASSSGFILYTVDIIEKIKEIANENITPAQLLEMIKNIYPDKNFTPHNLNNIITRHKIPHSSRRGKAKKIEEIVNDVENSKMINNINHDNEILTNDIDIIDNYDINNISSKYEESIDEEFKDIDNPMYQDVHINYNLDEERFGPIKQEIDSTLERHFKLYKCNLDKDYTTKDYIFMLETLLYLVEKGDDVVKKRRQQQNIMNAYQSDVIHTMENVIAEPGNTYFSDKMHLIRTYRRHYECDYKDVATLRPLRDSVDVNIVKSVLNNLKYNLQHSENPIFKPLVDKTLIDKYCWAKPIEKDDIKAKVALDKYNPNDFSRTSSNNRSITRIGMTAKTPPTSQLNAKTRKSMKIYRVSCKISGGGYGVYTPWYKDYECSSKNSALSYAQNTLDQLVQTKKDLIYTGLSVVEINTKSISDKDLDNNMEIKKDVEKSPIVFSKKEILRDESGLPKNQFKISCQLSCGSLDAPINWERFYTCVSEIQAKQAANYELEKIKQDYNDIIITELQCKQI